MGDFQVPERDQAFQVLEGDRTMNTSFTADVLDAARFAIRVEPKQDVASREIAQRPEGALHVPGHLSAA